MIEKIAVIGAGNMAEAMVRGWLSSGYVEASQMIVADLSKERLEVFAQMGVEGASDSNYVVEGADVVVLAVKPHQCEAVLEGLNWNNDALLVSIAAGRSTEFLEGVIGEGARVVRVMPNTPLLVGCGASGVCAGKYATAKDIDLVKGLLECVGIVEVVEESLIDALTAVSGSGPAYVFHLIEGMVSGGIAEGLTAEMAVRLATQTVIGAGKMVAQSDVDAGELRRRVTSPNGTTQEALEFMAANNWCETVEGAVKAASAKSRDMAKS